MLELHDGRICITFALLTSTQSQSESQETYHQSRPMIIVKDLVYEYPRHRAINGVSFTIEEGSITALVGPNGAGKTTLMKCLAALEKPFEGTIHIDGVDIVEHPRKCHRLLGFLPDFFGLYDELTVRQHLTYFALAHEVPENEIDARVRSTAAHMDLQEKLDESASNLSRGMRQRLAIGQTIIQRPKYVVLDEPASGLDPEARYELGQHFRRLREEGMTLIVSSHILAELDEYATSVLIMKEGRIVDHTAVEQLAVYSDILEVSVSNVDLLRSVVASYEPALSYVLEDSKLMINLSGRGEEQERLLQHLVSSGVGVREFHVKRRSLQDQYLNVMRETEEH